MPEGDNLPSPGDEYFEIECAKQHGGWPAWRRLAPEERAKLMAHELHRNMRDHYYFDKRKDKAEADRPAGSGLSRDVTQVMRDRFFAPRKE